MIREARREDIPAIRRLMETEPEFWQPDWSNETLTRALEAAEGLAFLCETGDKVTGFACAHDLGFRAYLSELIVTREVRRQGVGRDLLERIERALAARGRAILIADVWRDAVLFYRSLGWEPPDAVLLRRRISITTD